MNTTEFELLHDKVKEMSSEQFAAWLEGMWETAYDDGYADCRDSLDD